MAEQDQEQRTEEATARRRDEARDRGQVALSSELVAATGLAAGAGVLAVGGAQLVHSIGGEITRMANSLSTLGTQELSVRQSAQILDASLGDMARSLALVVVPTLLIGALTSYSQVGFRITPKAIEIDPDKLDPIRGTQRLFSLRSVVRTGMAAGKIALIAGAAASVAWAHVDVIARVGSSEIGPMLAAIGVVVMRTVAAAIAAILALAVVDVLYQRYQLAKDLRMTRQEIKEEHRLTEGDPHVKARIRAMQRMCRRRPWS
jgi:flagellar biosynthetic protein FlhB